MSVQHKVDMFKRPTIQRLKTALESRNGDDLVEVRDEIVTIIKASHASCHICEEIKKSTCVICVDYVRTKDRWKNGQFVRTDLHQRCGEQFGFGEV